MIQMKVYIDHDLFSISISEIEKRNDRRSDVLVNCVGEVVVVEKEESDVWTLQATTYEPD